MNKCKRDFNGVIEFKGDWCSVTNQPADEGCADAMKFSGAFAASSVSISE